MSARTIVMRCPQLDQLRHDLIEAYRLLEDPNLCAMAVDDARAAGTRIYLIHEAIGEHRLSCPICSFISIAPSPAHFIRQ